MTAEKAGPRERIHQSLKGSPIDLRNTGGTPGFTDNSVTVLNRRYLFRDDEGNPLEEPETMFHRVANNLSQADLNYDASETKREKTEKEFYQVMRDTDFVPNSPTLMNAGRELQQLSACFVLPIEDSLDSIFETAKETALIHKSGGGTGFSFNRIRPSGDQVMSTGGIASGPVSFIQPFDTATEVVKQGGNRRGANMGILNVDHPDILKFIHAKQDGVQLQNFNISVAVHEEFMRKVQEDEDYNLINPRDGEIMGKLKARDVFQQIVEAAWANGDPGIVFLDRINRENPNPHIANIESTNPCVTGDTWVMTKNGPRPAASLAGSGQTLLVNGQFFITGPEGFFSKGIRPVVCIKTREGHELTLTPDHLVTRIGHQPCHSEGVRDWIPAGEIRPGDQVSLHDHRCAHQKGNSILPMGKINQPVMESLRAIFQPGNMVLDPRESRPAIYLKDREPGMLETAQRELLYFGIRSQVQVTAGQGDRELAIQGKDLELFALRFGPATQEQQQALDEMALLARKAPGYPGEETYEATVESVEEAGEEEVWDVQVPGVNAFDANGIYVHNCGEQPLSPYESCNLGSVNLARMVRFTDDGSQIDWDRMCNAIWTGVHLLDNVIDMNEYPLEKIGEASRNTRRIGLGVMGWADMLVQLGIRYDSEEALNLARKVMRFIQFETHSASEDLANRRGTYPAWEGSIYDPPPCSEQEIKRMRNSAPVTIAPTGTISIIAGASSGIEPLFALVYTRNVMDNTRMIEVNPYFEAAACNEGFYSEELMNQVALTGSLEGTGLPQWIKDVFRVSQDIGPEWHVQMQAAFQTFTDNSVSKTINFPNPATTEDIWEAYMLAYQTGCKGITVYRDGSKTGQVLSTGQTGTDQGPKSGNGAYHLHPHPVPRPRPREMEGITRLVRTGHGNMYITINEDQEGYPFEIFTTVGKAGGCDSAQIEAISRLISLALRSGIEPGVVTNQLRGITCCPAWDEGVLIHSIPDGVARALDNHIGAGTPEPSEVGPGPARMGLSGAAAMPARTGARCPDCNAPAHFAEGCMTCTDPVCGWNKCG